MGRSRETNMNKLMVFQPGTPVALGGEDDGVPATVLAVAIYSHNIQYQVVWWSGRSRTVEWVEDFEIAPAGEQGKVAIGFAN